MNNESEIFQIILHSGEARTNVLKALRLLRNENIKDVYRYLEEANQSLTKAHKYQSQLISEEINGDRVELSLLMVHAQDHLMTTMAMRDFAKEIVGLFESKRERIVGE